MSNQPAPVTELSRKLRVRGNVATVTSVLALLVALTGGTAYAATHYRITSIKQIKPSVVKKLHGRPGPRGHIGKTGKDGAVAGYVGTVTTTDLKNAASTLLLSKAMPAGSYILHADVSIDAAEGGTPQAGAALSCSFHAGDMTQTQVFSSPYNSRDDNVAQGSLAFDLGVTDTSPITATITCTDYSGVNGAQGGDGGSMSALGTITAVRTTTNG